MVGVVDNDCAGCHWGCGVSAAITAVQLTSAVMNISVFFIALRPPG
ncbi:hypothetical protein LTSEURB_6735 [Salmonella enterica subsp. enterica serovar Urbana str. R8-2977]|uniref:Uncharacterized protein n=1 Tax=Salmonella enterica subsp. enterica serovar Urbana str. R8-2977 TaxID=913084 RepID=G5S5E1_SALET|nr:hypothetical protein LTSEURB_6735 [Salmonella enterica subsp. enterica serovar Urbana str. R8-2977]